LAGGGGGNERGGRGWIGKGGAGEREGGRRERFGEFDLTRG